ncbi:MAG: TetR family transcriptional regulator [Actinobacteria bacterium HGW-Actinobacteria-5]|jgi:AcrR family transcriptional regulator|nr:MAG: TetR family transcriptional regulator [Actinobacteria bacterium HGW-Actinobacteria-5]
MRVGGRAESSERTRELIIEAATSRFAARGYRATSLREIATAAGISHPGLLRHFTSKADLLGVVVDRLSQPVIAEGGEDAPRLQWFVDAARRNAATPGYVELFSGLLGVGVGASSPVHAALAARYAGVRTAIATVLAGAGAQPDPSAEAARLAAAWDGLQLISLYVPEVSVPDALAAGLAALGGEVDAALPVARIAPSEPSEPIGTPAGYSAGRRRRDQILEAATSAFAHAGFHGASLREIAELAEVSTSALLHHFSSKRELLLAVLQRRDADAAALAGTPSGTDPVTRLRRAVEVARRNQSEQAGLVELYVTLCAEAAAPDHPAHGYFERRFRNTINAFGSAFAAVAADGGLAEGRDPWLEGLWWVALWDGLQFQWSFDHDQVDVAALLQAHLDRVLSPAQ